MAIKSRPGRKPLAPKPTGKPSPKVAARPAVKGAAKPAPPSKRPTHRPPYAPNETDRTKVTAWTAFGLTQDQVSIGLGITGKTLRKYYRTELDKTLILAIGQIGQSLYNKAKAGDVNACKFYLQNRAPEQWSEKLIVQNEGAPLDLDAMSDEEIAVELTRLRRAGARSRAKPLGTVH